MKKLLITTAAALALSASAGLAADLAPVPYYKAPPPPPPAWSWNGCYIGGYAGGAGSSSVYATEPVSTGGAFPPGTFYNAPFGAPFSIGGASSFIGGGTLGCNWQWNSPLVLGIEGNIGGLHLRNSVVDPNSIAYGGDTRATATVGDWYGVIAGRVGFSVDRVLFYAKGGVAFANLSGSWLDTCTAAPCGAGTLNATGSTTATGGALGGGIEYAFNPQWSVKAEYLWLGFDQTLNVCGPGGGTAAGSTFCGTERFRGVNTGVIGLNYRFNLGGGPMGRPY